MRGRDLLGLSFRVIALVFVSVAGGSAVSTLLFLRDSIPATAVITEYSTTNTSITLMPEDAPRTVTFYPVAEYEIGGVTYRVASRSGSPTPRLQIGQSVVIVTRADNPGDARFDTLMGVWGAALVLAAVGVAFFVISYLAPLGFGGRRDS